MVDSSGISPDVQLGVCGNGVGVVGSGSTAKCSGSQSSPGTAGGGSGGASVLGAVVDSPIGLASAVPGLLAAGTLPFTGAPTLTMALAGLSLAGFGAGMLQLRRFGYKG